jgi:hypothetical protein
VGRRQEAHLKPFVAALAVAACLATPALRAAPLVSQFRPENAPASCRWRPIQGETGPARSPAYYGPYADLHAADAADAQLPQPAAGRIGSRGLGLLGRLRLSAFVLFMFPQYSLAISSEAPPPAPPSLLHPTAVTGGGGSLPPHGESTSPFPSLDVPPLSPPVSEAPEPTTLLSGALGAFLAGTFACWRRRR